MIDSLEAVRRSTGAMSLCLLRCTAGLLGLEAPLVAGMPVEEESVGAALAASIPVPARSTGELAQRLITLAAERRRGGARRQPLRIALPGGGGAQLLLLRGDEQAAASGLVLALDALVANLRAAPAHQEVLEACAFLGGDRRPALLADREGGPLAVSPLLRQMLGGDRAGKPFWLQPSRRAFFVGLRELAAGSVDQAAPVTGFELPASLRLERLVGGNYVLAVVQGEAARAAALRALAEGEITPRELTCGLRLAEGKSYREIAVDLRVSPDTVKLHLRALYQKLAVDGRDTLVARLAGLAPPPAVSRRAG